MLALLDIESKARGFVLRIADDARRRSSSTRGKGFAGSREFFDRDRLRGLNLARAATFVVIDDRQVDQGRHPAPGIEQNTEDRFIPNVF